MILRDCFCHTWSTVFSSACFRKYVKVLEDQRNVLEWRGFSYKNKLQKLGLLSLE